MTTSAAPSTMLRAERLSIGFRRRIGADLVLAKDLDFSIAPGELVALLGPNGAGKSSLLRTLAGLERPLGGRVFLEEKDVAHLSPAERALAVAVVLTERLEAGGLRVQELVALGRQPHTSWTGSLGPNDRRAVAAALARMGLASFADRRIGELSDGERQKAMIARALAQETGLLLLDEPTAFLDLPRRAQLFETLRALAHEEGKGILLSTHELDMALRAADRLFLLGEGGAFFVGVREELTRAGAFEAIFPGGYRIGDE